MVNKMLGRETVLEVDLLGTPLRLVVEARREIRRVHSISEEAALIRRMFEFLREGDVIYDVGANIGLIGLLLAQHPKGLKSRVHCFEPEPRNFDQLQRNIAENGLTERVSAHRVALAEREGKVGLFVRGGPGEGRHSTVASKGSTGSIQVATTTVSNFARASNQPPDLVKIDVEGAEGRVLAGMESLFNDHRPRELFLELHDKGEGDRMPIGESIDEWLSETGYSQVWNRARGISRHCHFR